MNAESKIPRLKEIIVEQLDGKCSDLLIEKMVARLDKVSDQGWDLEVVLNAIRVALKLFVDESLAKELHASLRAEAGLDG
jgi:hypothetical protein